MPERHITPRELAEMLSKDARNTLRLACLPTNHSVPLSPVAAAKLIRSLSALIDAGLVVSDGPQLLATPLGRMVQRIISEESEVDGFKPCPFCGAQRIKCVSEGEPQGPRFRVASCSGCGSQGPRADSDQEARKAWNKRHD